MKKNRLAIFASGNGSNAQRIIEYFQAHPDVQIVVVISNRKDAFVLERAKDLGIPAFVYSAGDFRDTGAVLQAMIDFSVTHIVLAGFLLLVPDDLLNAFPGKIINIHPALLPKFGGKGMYGQHVHEAVLDSGEKESGISIHLVDREFDHGKLLFQAKCEVLEEDTVDRLAARIHELEYKYFPQVIDQWLSGMLT